MKKCRLINGKVVCEKEDVGNAEENNNLEQIEVPKLVKQNANTNIESANFLHDAYDKLIKPNLNKEDESNLHPVYHHFKTRSNSDKVSSLSRERAILTKAALKYYETGSPSETNRYLDEMGLGRKYTIDFEMSNNDGLVAVNNETSKATIALRGSDKPWKTPSDWSENTENFLIQKTNPMNSTYGKRLDSFYENVNSEYEIDHITGYSKGGHGAISLGDSKGVPTTTFAPAVSLSNLKTTTDVRHEINNTTEDFASTLAEPMKLRNSNVTVNTLQPLVGTNELNPDATHSIEQYIKTDNRRSNHVETLTQKYITSKVKLDELNLNSRVKQAVNQKLSFTDFVRSENSSLVDNIDDTLKLPNRNNPLQKLWFANMGGFTNSESQQLTALPEAENTRFNNSQTELNDFVDSSPAQQAKTRIRLEAETNATANEIKTYTSNVDRTVRSRIIPTPRSAVVAGASLVAGKGIEEAVSSLDDITGSTIPSQSAPVLAAAGGSGLASVIGGGLATGMVAPEIAAGVGSYALASGAGQIAGQTASALGGNEIVTKQSELVTEGAVGGSSFLLIAGLVARAAVTAGAVILAPEITLPALIGSAVAGVAVTEAVDVLT